jgi:hypothetical protein
MKYLAWFLAGFGIVLSFQTFFVRHYGGDWTVLVRVGWGKPHERIEQELGPVACVDDQGHDGQINYLIARDPFDRRETHDAVGPSSNPPYRYRRILYPLLAGGFGWFSPWTTLWGLVFWLAIGAGLIATASAYLCQEWKLPGMALLFVLLSPGTYLAAQVLTNDVLATGFALAGVVLCLRGRDAAAAVLLAAAMLVRETSVLFSLCLAFAVYRQRGIRPALLLAVGPVLPILCWAVWVKAAIPGGNGFENFSLPFAGIVQSLAYWHTPEDVIFGLATLALMAGGVWIAWKNDNLLIRGSCLAWVALGVMASLDVWSTPGNALRAIGPLWVFMALGYGRRTEFIPFLGAAEPKNGMNSVLRCYTNS